MSYTVEPETVFFHLIEEWKAKRRNEGYDPLPLLTRCSKMLETAAAEFHARYPDPLDPRHSKLFLPGCKFGNLLTLLKNCKEFTDTMTSTYLKTDESPTNVGRVVIAAARLALTAREGCGISGLVTEEYIKVLMSWIINADEPLRTYATGLVDGDDIVNKSSIASSIELIATLLKRAWDFLKPDKCQYDECIVNEGQKELRPRKRPHSPDVPSEKDSESVVRNGDMLGGIGVNDLGNSGRTERMPVILGVHYSLDMPLSTNLRQFYIFGLLKCFGRYQELLSTFMKWDVLLLVNKYLEMKSDDRLVNKVLEFLSTLIGSHSNAATSFIALSGVQRLIEIPRVSMTSTGAALCLYKLAKRTQAMEKICHPPGNILRELIKYTMYLLECTYVSAKCHVVLFFSEAFSYRNVLSAFDDMNGLGYLVNLIYTTKYITHAADNRYDPFDDPDLPYPTLHTIKLTCGALKTYFEAHIAFKVGQLAQSCPVLQRKYYSYESVARYESAMHATEYFDVLRELADKCDNFNLEAWAPIAYFESLGGVPLLLKIVDDTVEFDVTMIVAVDVGQVALDVLSAVTLSRSSQMMLTNLYDTWGMEHRGLNIILKLIESLRDARNETYVGGVSLNSAVAVIANCTGGTCAKSRMATVSWKVHGTPKYNKNECEVKEALCKRIRRAQGMQTLLSLFQVAEPAVTSDETRYFACKALVGLAEYEPAREVLSKLHFFTSKLLPAILEPVLKDNRDVHVKFCENMELLFKTVTGNEITLDADVTTAQRTDVVSGTRVRYPDQEVLFAYSHLVAEGLRSVAGKLAQDVGMFSDVDDGNAFSRRNRASSDTPLTNLSTGQPSGSDVSANMFVAPDSRVSQSRSTLNSVIKKHSKRLHSVCQDPVVTVPQFSVFTPQHYPEPRKPIEASINVQRRLYYRQGGYSKLSGIGGMGHDLRLIYSRFKPARVIKSTENPEPHLTAVAFVPNDNDKVTIGDSVGDVHILKLTGREDRVLVRAFNHHVTTIEPTHTGDLMLASTRWPHECVLLTVRDDQCTRKTDLICSNYAEFSKAAQDKIVGTRFNQAIIYDAATLSTINVYGENLMMSDSVFDEESYLACQYEKNRATFSYDDRLVLSDGHLWDVRKPPTSPVHTFDQFSDDISGVFHPNGREVIINTEVWDLRNCRLIQSIPTLDLCRLKFNRNRNVLYGIKVDVSMVDRCEECECSTPAFMTFDSSNYNQLGYISVKQQVRALALDDWDRNVAVIEAPASEDPPTSVCRMYEVGMKSEDEAGYCVDSAF